MKRTVGIGLLVLLALLLLLLEPWGPSSPAGPEAPREPDASPPDPGLPGGPPEVLKPGEDGPPAGGQAAIPPFVFRVTDVTSGDPVEGVRIEPEGDPDPDEGPAPLRGEPATTGEDGRGEFVVDHPGFSCVSYRAGKPGWLLARGLADRGETTEIRLTRGAPISGRVTHAIGGAPVEGAVVRAFARMDRWFETCRPAVTDREGAFLLDAVPPGRKVLLVARAEGLVPARAEGSFPKEGGSVEIRVGGGGVLEGRVTRPDGSPGAGTEVWLVRPGLPLPPRRSDGHWLAGSQLERLIRFLHPQVTTDEGGGFRFEGVPIGKDRIAVARLSEHREAESEPARFERDGEALVRDIRIPEPAQVTITVLDDRGGIVQHPQVDFRSPRVWFDVRSAGFPLEDGRQYLPDVAPGDWKLRAWIRGADAIDKEVTLAPGEHAEIEFRAPRSPTVEGIVVDPAGDPVWGAEVTATAPPWVSGGTDEEGRFRLTGLVDEPTDIEVRPGHLFGRRGKRPLAPSLVRSVRPGSAPLRIVLPYGGFLTGRIPGFEPGTQFRLEVFSRKVSSGGGIRIDESGGFKTEAPAPGDQFLVKISHGGEPPNYAGCAALKPGEDRDLGEIRFDGTRRLEGRVVGPDGAPIEGAEVRLVERWLDITARTDEEGRFRFRDMPVRPIWALVKAKGLAWHFVVFDPPGEGPEPVVRMTRGGLLRGKVESADGTPVAKGEYLGSWLVTHPLDENLDELRIYFAFGDGAFSHRLQPGRYRFAVWDEDHTGRAETEFEIGEGGEVARTFRLVPD